MKGSGPVYRVELRAEPDQVPAVVRLRKALKLLGRAFGLRALSLEEVKVDQSAEPGRNDGEDLRKPSPPSP